MNKTMSSLNIWRITGRILIAALFGFSFIFAGLNPAVVRASPTPELLAQAGEKPAVILSNELAGQRTLSFPANALNYDKTSTILSQYATGIRWQANFAAGAYLNLPRPADWDGASDVTLRLFFFPITPPAANNAVSFFIRPRAFNSGDLFADEISLNAPAVPVTANLQVREQVFTIPASRFGTKDQWVITIQRGGEGETYAGDVVLTSVGVSYATAPVTGAALGFPANALNYDKTSTILSQYATGIRWQANFAAGAYLILPRPADWDGTSDVTLRLFFYSTTTPGANNAASFFIRPRAFDSGDIFVDEISLNAPAVPVTAANQVREQVFTIPASRFGTKDQWVITIQRGGEGETYTGDVVLTSVGVSYAAAPVIGATLGFPANALNYDKTSTILSQYATGIRWQANFAAGAYLILPRPADWDGTSDVTLRLFFYSTTTPGANNAASFFIRPRAFDSGDQFVDEINLDAPAVPVTANLQVREQVFTIPASRFGTKAQWVITIQRGGEGETYTGDVILTSVGLSYNKYPVYIPILLH